VREREGGSDVDADEFWVVLLSKGMLKKGWQRPAHLSMLEDHSGAVMLPAIVGSTRDFGSG
jgi:Cft2 family RNA processing exonuclease